MPNEAIAPKRLRRQISFFGSRNMQSLLVAILLAYLLNPVVGWLERRYPLFLGTSSVPATN